MRPPVTDQLERIAGEARSLLGAASTPGQVEEVRVKFLGRKGLFSELFASIAKLPSQDRPTAGQAANRLKAELTALLKQAAARVARVRPAAVARFDPTLPSQRPAMGHVHPLSLIIEEICDIFRTLGFSVAEGPEVELDWYNFDALNIPPDHPSRDDFDTFYISDHVLLRSQTSTVQIRTMEKTRPPVRIIAPGRCFRPETEDARHAAVFHQVEGLVVDEGISFSDLKAVIHMFARQMFSPDVRVRFRPSFFPFTEPSAEVDCTCPACSGSGCGTCSHSGWVEFCGAGMVDPNVFDAVGYDKERYTGFAFGMGVERIAMRKYGIKDLRLFYHGDLRFLQQF